VYLTYNGTLCQTYYFSSDGGATEDSAHVWGGSYGYLVGKIDPYEAAVASQITSYTKTATLSRTGSELSALAKAAGLGNTTIAQNGIQIETYPATGNVKSITLTGSNGRTVTISQSSSYTRWDFLKAFGITSYSYRYTVTYNAATDSFTCTRQGWGHQVGLSQWGAYAMAKYYNKTYQDILGFYYSGTHLQYGA
jgi:stage II sporulation protein D